MDDQAHRHRDAGTWVKPVTARRAVLAVALAAVAGAAVWLLSPWMTGQVEPWDAENFYYVAALVTAGIVCGAAIPRPLWAHYAGSVAGQAIYELAFLPLGPLFIIGLAFLLMYSLLFLAGALAGSSARLRFDARAARLG